VYKICGQKGTGTLLGGMRDSLSGWRLFCQSRKCPLDEFVKRGEDRLGPFGDEISTIRRTTLRLPSMCNDSCCKSLFE
jgi:hypothetical protein